MNSLFCIFQSLFCIIFLFGVNSKKFQEDENNILLLNNDTYQEAINEFKTFFVFIYIKDASETMKSVLVINEVGKELKKRSITTVLAKLSLDYDNDILARYNVDGSSAFMAIMDHGERYVEFTETIGKIENIIKFIERKMETPVKQIEDPDLLRAVIENSKCISVGFFENFTTPEYEEYKSNADWYYHCDHFAIKNPQAFKYYKVEDKIPTVKMFKGCIHDSIDFPDELPLQGMHILKFFLVSMEPDVAKYGMDWLMKRTFKDPQFTLMLFVSIKDTKKESYINILEKYARRYREEINMVYAEVDGDEDISILLYTFDIKPTDAPLLRAIELANRFGNNTRKYKPKRKAINDDSVKRFIGDVYYRQVQPYLISETLPADWNKDPIVTIVGETFRNVTEDPTKTVVVAFYNFENKYDTFVKGQLLQLATDFKKEGRTDILICKSNYNFNEYYGWHPNKFPAIILFPKGIQKFGILYNMELFYENMKLFIESDGKINKEEDAKQSTKSSDNKDSIVTNDNEEVVLEDIEEESNYSSQRTEL